MPLRWILVATVVLALATLASCRGGGNEIDEALESVTPADLAIMVLPKQEIGNIADDFVVLAEGSGFDDSTSMAEGTIDPDDTAEDWERRGWLSAYCLNYSTPDLAAAVKAGREIGAPARPNM